MKTLPASASDLIDALDAAYPPSCIRRGESPEDAHRRAGARELVERLKELRETTRSRELSGKLTVRS